MENKGKMNDKHRVKRLSIDVAVFVIDVEM